MLHNKHECSSYDYQANCILSIFIGSVHWLASYHVIAKLYVFIQLYEPWWHVIYLPGEKMIYLTSPITIFANFVMKRWYYQVNPFVMCNPMCYPQVEICWGFFVGISQRFISMGPDDNKSALLWVMAWHWTDNRISPKPITAQFV